MKRLYKSFLIATWLLLLGAFTSTSLGQAIKPFSTNAAGTITLLKSASTMAEDGGSVTLTAKADIAPTNGATITVTITAIGTGSTASVGDYVLGSTTITIVGDAGGNDIGITTLTGVPDSFLEGMERVIVEITGVSDDDASNDYTEDGAQFQIVEITDAESLALTGGATIAEDGGTAILTATVSDGGTLKLNGGGSLSITLTYTGTASNVYGTDFTNTGGADPETLTLTNGSSSIATTITGETDAFLEGDETAIATMTTGVTGLTIGGTPQTVTITDAERVTLSPAPTTPIAEAAGTSTLTATVSGGGTLVLNGGGSLTVTLTYSGTATNGVDYIGSTTITITNTSSSGTTLLTAIQDTDEELDEKITATITGTSVGTNIIGSPAAQTVTITDDETVLSTPGNNSTGQDLNVQLNWRSVDGADQYKLYVNTASDFTGTAIINGVDQGNVFLDTPGGLNDNTKYYWKVIPRNIATSDTRAASDTEVRNFTTTQQGDGTFPLDNAVGVELFPTLTWPTGPTGTDKYRLEVNTLVGFNGTSIYDNAALTTTSQQIAGLSNATEYFWRVTASSNLQKVNSSNVFSFTTSTDKYVTLGYPKNSDVVTTLTPTLNWVVSNSVAGLTYEYQYNTANSFTDASPTPIASSSTSATVTTVLTPGQTYYWRARSKTSGGLYSQWSSVGIFVVGSNLQATPVPTILWPTGNSTQYTATPTFSWYLTGVYTGVIIDHYVVEVDDDPAFGSITQTITTPTNATTIAANTGLTPGTQYYWRVRSVGTGGTSGNSTSGSFTIDIGQGGAPAPILSWPIGGVYVYTITPTLYWYLGTGTTGTITYNVGVSSTAANALAGTYDIWDGGTVSDQNATVPQSATLSGGTTYYWSVRTNNSANGGSSSAYVQTNGSFTLASNVSNTPDAVQSYPIGGVYVYNSKPTLYWYLASPAPSGATLNFNIKVSDQTNFTGGVTHTYSGVGSATLTNYTITDVLPAGTYYWQIQTNRTNAPTGSNSYTPATGTSANSFVVVSTASGLAVTPTPLYPTGSSVVSSLTPTLSWTIAGVLAGDEVYNIELKPTSLSFDGNGLVTSTSQSITTVTLQPNTAYRWRVQSTSATNGSSSWSSEALFSTAATLAPPPPMVDEPINGVVLQNNTPEITWFMPTAPKGALKYKLQISDDMFMTNIVAEYDDIDAFHTQVNTLESGKTYYWRVQSKDENGVYSPHSNVGRFTTMSITGIEDLNVIPTEFAVSQNYPNPFNPTTTIRYAIPEASFVILKIYNMLGQEVKTLVNGEKNAGTFNVQWRGDNDFGVKVSSGTYIYRVIAGSHIFTKKMILLK